MSRFLDFLAFCCFALGLTSLALGGYLYVRDLDQPGVYLEQERIELGEVPAKKDVTVYVAVVNPTWHTVRLVGIGHC